MAGSGWTETTIGQLCDDGVLCAQTGPFGSQLHKHDYVPNGIPVIPTEAIGRRLLRPIELPKIAPETAERLSRHRVLPGDILFARRGVQATGLSALVNADQADWVCGTGAILLRILDGRLDAEFLSFALSSESSFRWLRQHAVGAVMPNLNESVIRGLPLNIPPLPEQKAIAHILGTLDDKIELNRRMNETLEGMARALFKSWFVDFDPVRAKMDGRPTPGLDPATAKLFPDGFEHVDEQLIPKGWRVLPLSSMADLTTDSVSPASQPDCVWEHYSIPAFDEGKRPVNQLGREIKSNKYRVPQYSILVSKLNPQFPRIWRPDIREPSVAICSTEFMPFVPKQSKWRPFLFELTRSDDFQEEIILRVTGSTGSRQRVKPKEVAELPIVAPPRPIVDRFAVEAGRLHELQLTNIREQASLATLRNALLPKLLSGEIRVGDAKKTLEATA